MKMNLLSKILLRIFGPEGKRGVSIPFVVLLLIATVAEWLLPKEVATIVQAVLLGLFGYYLWWGFRVIPADDPITAVAMQLFGDYTNGVKGPGIRFFPPGYSGVEIDVTKENHDFSVETRTSDRANVRFNFGLTFSATEDSGAGLVQFIKIKKLQGARDVLEDIISTQVRQLAASEREGPVTWMEAIRSQEETLAVLIKAVNGNDIFGETEEEQERVHGILRKLDIPLSTLYKREVKKVRKNEMTLAEVREWGEDWEKYDERMQVLTDNEKRVLHNWLHRLDEKMREAKQGRAKIFIRDTGIYLQRLSIKTIEPLGAVAEAADKEAKEEQERLAEEKEMGHVENLIKRLTKANVPPGMAAEMVQTERGKVSKTIEEKKLSVSSELADLAPQIAAAIASAIKGRKEE